MITASINILTMQTKTEKKQERTGRKKTDIFEKIEEIEKKDTK